MPEVKPMNLPKFPPMPRDKSVTYNIRQWRPKKTPKANKKIKLKLVDKSIIQQVVDQNTHLRDIYSEE